uniref:Probable JmjC domain-containing histone demethylation protein 2C n=1 Tax=Callorhinchus milii TaxID=7868 RepID=A0A4W3GCZ4_CALMI
MSEASRAATLCWTQSPEIESQCCQVYVEFDDLEWENREWVKVYEDFQIFLVEDQLVWAKRKNPSQCQGSKNKLIQWPALTFKSIVEKTVVHLFIAIEFFVDKQLNFVPGDSAFQLYQDDVDSLNPVLRDNPQLHEEVKAWVKEQKVQEIFMQGPYSLNGYRVRVYRQDSATQWFTGIITYHDLLSRTMIVMNDQVLEPQNVDPSMVQMTFLDDVVPSLLKGENLGITSRRRSRSSQKSTTAHGHYTRAQANSPRPVMNSQTGSVKQNQQQLRNIRLNKRKGSDSSVPEEEKMKEEKCDSPVRGESSKTKTRQASNKRRKPEEDEKQITSKRLKADNNSDTESSDSENSTNKIISDSSSEQSSESELKNKNTSDDSKDEGKSQENAEIMKQSVIHHPSPCNEMLGNKNNNETQKPESIGEKMDLQQTEFRHLRNIKSQEDIIGCIVETKGFSESQPGEPSTETVLKCISNTENGTQSADVFYETTCSNSCMFTSQEVNYPNPKPLVTNQSTSDIGKSELDVLLNSKISSKIHSEVLKTFLVINESNSRSEKEETYNASRGKTIGSARASAEISKKNKPNTSSDVIKAEINYLCSPAASVARPASRSKTEFSRASFQPVEITKSPLIVDKNEHFTVYRDPALINPNTEAKHMSLYLHPHLRPLHTSAQTTCLTTSNSHPALATPHHQSGSSSQSPVALNNAPHHSVQSSHLHPAVLPGVPSASLLCRHLDPVHTRNLTPLALAHHQQQFLQQHSPQLLGQAHPSAPYNQLGLYPIIWQYPNGTHLSSGLNMTSSKWVHPENSMNSEASLRRNTSSPWLPQPTTVTSADSLGLLSHIPVCPASADSHRPLKLTQHSSPPLLKSAVDHQKEEIDSKTFAEPLYSVAPVQTKPDFDHGRPLHGLESQLPRCFTNTIFSQGKQKRTPQEQNKCYNKYKEESRRILQESIEVAPFATTIKVNESVKDTCSRIPCLPTASPKPQNIKQERETQHCATELYTLKNSIPQTLPQSNYFTTLSNSIVNEPPRLYPYKETVNPYSEKTNPSTPSHLSYNNKTLSKPPPLIKHQPEGERLRSKITEQLSKQVSSQTGKISNTDYKRTREQLSGSSTTSHRIMPSLHRAPVYLHSSQHIAERKEGNYRNLSPPTLTPIQPVHAAVKLSELQKPPTLLPEPRADVKNYMNNPALASADIWKNDAVNRGKRECHSENSSKVLQVTQASVIVRPPSAIKQDNLPEMQSNAKESGRERSLTWSNPVNYLKPSEVKEVGRIILPNLNLDTTCTQYEKSIKAFQPCNSLNSLAAPNSLCNSRTDLFTSVTQATNNVSGNDGTAVANSSSSTTVTNNVPENTAPRTSAHSGIQTQECKVNITSSAAFVTTSTRTGSTTQNNASLSSTTDYYQLKKHKAALAMAHSGTTNANNNEHASLKSEKSSTCLSPNSNGTANVSHKVNSITNGQTVQSSQPSYHTKLKKAWLTRHSEEDKNTKKTETSEKDTSTVISVCSLASSSDDKEKIDQSQEEKTEQEEPKMRRGTKRVYESGSESDASDESESKSDHRVKRQPKPTYKKRQNDLQKRKGDIEKDEEEIKPNGTLCKITKEKNKSKLQSDGLPRSVLKDWRKVKKLKQTGESFLQDGSCSQIAPNLQKCRECRMVRYRKNEEISLSAVFCRFYYFRRLAFSKNAVLRTDGFSTPEQYDEEAINLWLSNDSTDVELDIETSKYILSNIGDKFCQIETSEKAAISWLEPDAKIAWKRAVKGVQEMCDACEATLFNIHWVCQKCGFVVCLDCYKARESNGSKEIKDLYVWLKCVKGQVHDAKSLMPTQIIPGSVLADISDMMNTFRNKWEIITRTNEQNIQLVKLSTSNGISQVLQSVLNHNTNISATKQNSTSEKLDTNGSSTSPVNEVTIEKTKEVSLPKTVKIELNQADNADSLNCKASPVCLSSERGSTLRDLLTTTAGKLRLGSTNAGIAFAPVFSAGTPTGRGARNVPNILDDIIASVVENKIPPSKTLKLSGKEETKENDQGGIKNLNLDEVSKTHAAIPHSWLCDGRLLWLQDPRNHRNWRIFRECWRREQPVLVSSVHKNLNSNIWKPESFRQEFGEQKGDLINCKDGTLISNIKIQDFWDGFEDSAKRLKTKTGEVMLLKLKDWLSGEELRTMMPSRYDDLMRNLPLPEYCDPEGNLNLASRLPNFFVRPDLGPRLNCAFGQTTAKDYGTTNLHLDIADVVNILVYVSVPKGSGNSHKTAIWKRIEEEEMDENTKKRLKDCGEIPGALWHIYSANDAKKIRELLQKERGQESVERDPIRDQSCYLNKKLRWKLYEEYRIQSWTIFQFLGDAIFIPAGALRQVQNIYNCIQVSEEFVSPEHVVHSFHLTQELRHQSNQEINYEDKLQVKNIIYHSIKDAVVTLKMHEEKMSNAQNS